MNTKILIHEAISLPVEERAMIVDSLLKSLNQPEAEIDAKWAQVASKRLAEMKTGNVIGVPADQVFSKVMARFNK